MKQVLVIAGPTAIGKTAFSLEVAQRYEGEIVSGDSVQVYRGLDIGSGKATKDIIGDIPHHLIDICDAKENYDIHRFQSDVRDKIEEISQRGHLPIIVGGSGLYLKSALYDYRFKEEVTADDEYSYLSNQDLYERLKEVDSRALEKIHINNRKRLLRAYNYYLKNGQTMSENIENQRHEPLYDVLFLGLTCERAELYERIDKRVNQMIVDGLKEEVTKLLDMGLNFSFRSMQAIGYRQWEAYFKGEAIEEEVAASIKKATRNFAKRQYTWFNNQLPMKWCDIKDLDSAYKEIDKWII